MSIDNNSRSEPFDAQSTLCALYNTQLKQNNIASIIENERALYYFLYGLCRRLKMIAQNLKFFFDTTPPNRTHPLNETEINDAITHLNSLYVNIYGAIDNIAWVYAYEMNFYADVNIERTNKKKEICLFNSAFLKKMKTENTSLKELSEYLETKKDWYINMSELRAPSTHRIPLYVIPATLNQVEEEKYTHHQQKHMEEALNRNYNKADKHFDELHQIGQFVPFFAHDPAEKPTSIYPTINIDCQNLIEIIDKAFNIMEKEKKPR